MNFRFILLSLFSLSLLAILAYAQDQAPYRIEIESPAQATQVAGGSSLEIKWNVSGSNVPGSRRVTIRYQIGSGAPVSIVENHPDSGIGTKSYTWQNIPRTITSDEVVITLNVTAQGANEIQVTSKSFKIDSTPPRSGIDSVLSRGSEPGAPVSFGVQAEDGSVGVGVREIVVRGRIAGGEWQTLGRESGTRQRISVPIEDGKWEVVLQSTDHVGNSEEWTNKTPFALDLDRAGPQLSTTSSHRGIYLGGTEIQVSWNSVDVNPAPGGVGIEFFDGQSYLPIVDRLPASGSYTFVAPYIDSRNCGLRILAKDAKDNVSTPITTGTFAVQAYPPTALITRPITDEVRAEVNWEFRIINLGILTVKGIRLWESINTTDPNRRIWNERTNFDKDIQRGIIPQASSQFDTFNKGYAITVTTVEGDTNEKFNEPTPIEAPETRPELEYNRYTPPETAEIVSLTPSPAGMPYRGGQKVTILWDPEKYKNQSPVSNAVVQFQYSVDGGRNFVNINDAPVALSPANRQMEWTIPQITEPNVLLRLRTTDNVSTTPGYDYYRLPGAVNGGRTEFAIDSSPPVGWFEGPYQTSSETITLNYKVREEGAAGVKTIELYARNVTTGAGWRKFATSPYSIERPQIEFPATDEGEYECYLRAEDTVGNAGSIPEAGFRGRVHKVLYDKTPPSIRLTSPTSDQTYSPEDEVLISWTTDARDLADTPFSVLYSVSSDDTFEPIVEFLPADKRSYTWRVPRAAISGVRSGAGAPLKFKVVAFDKAGNSGSAESLSFGVQIDTDIEAQVTGVERRNTTVPEISYRSIGARLDTDFRFIRIYYTHDGGRTWALAMEDENFQSPARWQISQSGLGPGIYGFSATAGWGSNQQENPPQPGQAPEWPDVMLDWEPPICDLSVAARGMTPQLSRYVFPLGDEITLGFSIEEQFIRQGSISLTESVGGGEPKVLSLPEGGGLSGQIPVTLPSERSNIVYKLVAQDQAGNRGEDELTVEVQPAPQVILRIDSTDMQFRGNEFIPLSWTVNIAADDQVLQDNPFYLEYTLDGGATWAGVLESSGWNIGRSSYNFPAPPNVTSLAVKFRLSVTNRAGISGVAETGAVSVLSTIPSAEIVSIDEKIFNLDDLTGEKKSSNFPLEAAFTQGSLTSEEVVRNLDRVELWMRSRKSPTEIWRGPASEDQGRRTFSPGEQIVFNCFEEGAYDILLRPVDKAGNAMPDPNTDSRDYRTVTVNVDLGPPRVSLLTHNRRRIYFTRTEVPVLWRATDLKLDEYPIEISLAKGAQMPALDAPPAPDGAWKSVTAGRIANSLPVGFDSSGVGSPATGFLFIDMPEEEGSNYRLRVRAMDASGEWGADASDEPFVVVQPYYKVSDGTYEFARSIPNAHLGEQPGVIVYSSSVVDLVYEFDLDVERTGSSLNLSPADRMMLRDERLLPPPVRGVTIYYRRADQRQNPWRSTSKFEYLPARGIGASGRSLGEISFVPPSGDGVYDVYYVIEDAARNESMAPRPDSSPHAQIVIDTTPPRIRIVNAADWNTGYFREGESRRLGWIAEDADSRPLANNSVQVEYSIASGVAWSAMPGGEGKSPQGEYQVRYEDLRQRSGTYFVRAKVTDLAGNASYAQIYRSFVIDSDRPTVFVTKPGTTRRFTENIDYEPRDVGPGGSPGSGIEVVYLFARKMPDFENDQDARNLEWKLIAQDRDGMPPMRVTFEDGRGVYELYALAEDRAGNRSISAGTSGRLPVLSVGTPAQMEIRVDDRPLRIDSLELAELDRSRARHENRPMLPAGRQYTLRVQYGAPSLGDVHFLLEQSIQGGREGTFTKVDSNIQPIASSQIRFTRQHEATFEEYEFRWDAPSGNHSDVVLRVSALILPAMEIHSAEDRLDPRGSNVIARSEWCRSLHFALDGSAPVVHAPAAVGEVRGSRDSELESGEAYFESLLRSGEEYMRDRQYQRAAEVFERAVVEKDDNPEGHYLYARALRMMGRESDRLEIRRHLRRAIELDEGHAHAHVELGLWHEQRSEYMEAIASYRNALASMPRDPDAHYVLGRVYYKRGTPGDDRLCVDQLYQVFASNPRHPEALELLYRALYWSGRTEEAETPFEALAEIRGLMANAERETFRARLQSLPRPGSEW
ncbi:MAG: tetratricopeptide repeat protein [Planctomycetes bacterium]|nr:tetratricopeptide repeat protein [Planctomycetota bacterium]